MVSHYRFFVLLYFSLAWFLAYSWKTLELVNGTTISIGSRFYVSLPRRSISNEASTTLIIRLCFRLMASSAFDRSTRVVWFASVSLQWSRFSDSSLSKGFTPISLSKGGTLSLPEWSAAFHWYFCDACYEKLATTSEPRVAAVRLSLTFVGGKQTTKTAENEVVLLTH